MIKNLINNFFKDWVVFDGRLDRKSLSYKKYLYRFDPITSRLKEAISSSEEGVLSNNIYSCEQTENNF